MHMDALVEDEKKSALKELVKQMYALMCKEDGGMAHEEKESPEEEMAEEGMEKVSDLSKKVAEATNEEMGDEMTSDLDKDEKADFMRKGKSIKAPMKGSMMMIKVAANKKAKKGKMYA